jgi:hypothetical protein
VPRAPRGQAGERPHEFHDTRPVVGNHIAMILGIAAAIAPPIRRCNKNFTPPAGVSGTRRRSSERCAMRKPACSASRMKWRAICGG